MGHKIQFTYISFSYFYLFFFYSTFSQFIILIVTSSIQSKHRYKHHIFFHKLSFYKRMQIIDALNWILQILLFKIMFCQYKCTDIQKMSTAIYRKVTIKTISYSSQMYWNTEGIQGSNAEHLSGTNSVSITHSVTCTKRQ